MTPKSSDCPLVFVDVTRLYRKLPKMSQTPSSGTGPFLIWKVDISVSSLVVPPKPLNHLLVSKKVPGSSVGPNGQNDRWPQE